MSFSARQLVRALSACTGIACALLVGRGVWILLEGSPRDAIIPSAPILPIPPGDALRVPRDHPRAKAILRRNVFDSRTGPLGDGAPSPAAPPSVHPFLAPPCRELSVVSTAVARDPEWTSAVVRQKGAAHGQLRYVGDTFEGRKLVFVGYNAYRRSPAAWFREPEGLCQSLVFGKPPPPPPKQVKKRPRRPVRSAPPRRARIRGR